MIQIELDIDLPVKGSFAQCQSSNLTHEIGKYDFGGGANRHCRFGVNHPCRFWGGDKSYRRFTLKSSMISYTKSSEQFIPPKIGRDDLPQICSDDLPKSAVTIYPKSAKLSKISDTQHHALLHKGLFCERPKRGDFVKEWNFTILNTGG